VYPGPEVLQEVGRITIAGSRLDIQMGHLWHHLDRSVPFEETRWKPGTVQTDKVRRLAQTCLTGGLQAAVLAAVEDAEEARDRRNDVVHQDWLLRSPDATRPVSEWLALPEGSRAAYLEEWERESKESQDWRRVPRRGINVEDAPSLAELVAVERLLSAATTRVLNLVYTVASSRETGQPPGYVRPGDADQS
jgi:hypothetical protein